MGTSIHAIIEYDRTRQYLSDEQKPPFSDYTDSVVDLSDFIDLRSGKDYRFIGAISGIRNKTGIEPLFPLRGCPPYINSQTLQSLDKYYDPDGSGIGWLYFRGNNRDGTSMFLCFYDRDVTPIGGESLIKKGQGHRKGTQG